MEITREDLREEVVKLSNTVKLIKKQIDDAELNLLDENQVIDSAKFKIRRMYEGFIYNFSL